MRFNVQAKFSALVMLVGSAALALTCASFIAYDRAATLETKRGTSQVLTEAVAQTLVGPMAFQDGTSTQKVLENLAAEPTALSASAVLPDGAPLGAWRRAEAELPEPRLTVDVPVRNEAGDLGRLVVSYSTADVAAKTQRFLAIATSIFAVMTVASLALSWVFGGRLVAPIHRLAGAADHVRRSEDYTVRVGQLSHDEIGELGAAFDDMLSAIQRRDAELEAHRHGLEDLVARRTADLDQRNVAMRQVLDHVQQGFLTLDRDGRISSERSRAFDDWFGAPGPGATFGALLGRRDPRFGAMFELAWEGLSSDWMPLEMALAQLPATVSSADRRYVVEYQPIGREGALEGLLVMVTDVTDRLAAEAAQQAQVQLAAALSAIQRDRVGFEAFLAEGDEAVRALGESDLVTLRRRVHTLKGNCGMFALQALASRFHTLEERLDEGDEVPPETLADVADQWRAFVSQARPLLGGPAPALALTGRELAEVRRAIDHGEGGTALLERLEALGRPEVEVALGRLGAQAVQLGQRLGRAVACEVVGRGVRLPEAPFRPLLSAMVHLVRNAVDHGLEDPHERAAARKPPAGRLELGARWVGASVELVVADDGRGVDWDAVAAAARRRGLRGSTREDLVEALFSDGVSTRDAASEISGRGVGMAALRAAVRDLDGEIRVETATGQGTRVILSIPANAFRSPPAAVVDDQLVLA